MPSESVLSCPVPTESLASEYPRPAALARLSRRNEACCQDKTGGMPSCLILCHTCSLPDGLPLSPSLPPSHSLPPCLFLSVSLSLYLSPSISVSFSPHLFLSLSAHEPSTFVRSCPNRVTGKRIVKDSFWRYKPATQISDYNVKIRRSRQHRSESIDTDLVLNGKPGCSRTLRCRVLLVTTQKNRHRTERIPWLTPWLWT
jgi:hypothetical protein